MTPWDKSILVRGPLPPLPKPRIVFAPGSGATFDGGRWYVSFAVLVDCDETTRRRSFARRELDEALAWVGEAASRHEPSAVVLDGRDWLGEPLGERVVERIEAALEDVAREVDAIIVVRILGPTSGDDHDRYGAVIDAADDGTWRGEPADPRPRPYSHSRDTGPGRPTQGR